MVDLLHNPGHVHALPEFLDLGVTCVGSVLQGSFRLSPATVIHGIRLESEAGNPKIIELIGTEAHRDGSLLCKFRALTHESGKFLVLGHISTDKGVGYPQIALEVHTERGYRDVLFCESPYNSDTSHYVLDSLKVLIRELHVNMNSTDEPSHELSSLKAIVFHGNGLTCFLKEYWRESVRKYLENGGIVIILADHFCRNSVMKANHIIEPYGIRIMDCEYDEVLCDHGSIASHSVTRGLKRLRWVRPSPIVARNPAALLVLHPEKHTEGFVACSGPYHNLFVVGVSRLKRLLCAGWPFQNGELLANMLLSDTEP